MWNMQTKSKDYSFTLLTKVYLEVTVHICSKFITLDLGCKLKKYVYFAKFCLNFWGCLFRSFYVVAANKTTLYFNCGRRKYLYIFFNYIAATWPWSKLTEILFAAMHFFKYFFLDFVKIIRVAATLPRGHDIKTLK